MATRGDSRWGDHVLATLGAAADVPLADTLRAAADGLAPEAFPQHDLMHCDFHHRNLLVRHRRLTGVVDWDGVRAGDRVFDLVTLAFCSAVATCQEGAVDRLWERARSLRPAGVVRAYAALMALRQLEWSIGHRTPADVDSWTAIAERVLADLTS
jgi:aminoglycoside phosphotransferase (APT) family kinase protein